MVGPQHRIFVTDGNERVALALVRAFGGQGHRVVVGASTPRPLAAASRFAAAQVQIADPSQDPAAFVRDVREALDRTECDVLMPVSEAALYAVLGASERFSDVLIPFADAERFRRISDKVAVASAAASAGIAVPQHVTLTSADEIDKVGRLDRAPFVVKPARSVVASGGRQVKVPVTYAPCRDSLGMRLRNLISAAYPVMIQERIVGPGLGVFALRWDGRIHALFAHRRLREKPPSGGVSVYCESVPLDGKLRDRVVRLLEQLDWDGVAMVEFKVDEVTGVPYLMEINGRFWGSLQLAIDAGVDFPNLLLKAAMGRHSSELPSWSLGVRSRWWWGDVDHLIARLRRRNQGPDLRSAAPSRWTILREWIRSRRSDDRSDVFRSDDPKPFVWETLNWFSAVLRRS